MWFQSLLVLLVTILYHLPLKTISEIESCSFVSDSVTPWTVQSMEFSRPEYWSVYPFPSPGNLPNPRTEPGSPTLQADSLLAEPQGKPSDLVYWEDPEGSGREGGGRVDWNGEYV